VNAPAVSVVMPVYNGEKYLRESIDSILNQTYTDYEFIIVNDGSNDKTEEIILSYNDNRIRYIKNEKNLQIVKSLNRGIELAKGRYIARMDADDISLPRRFEKQITFMENNLEIGVCGTWLKTIGEKEEVWKLPVIHEEIAMQMFFSSSIMHPTVFLRTAILKKLTHIYSDDFNKAEDYELWTRLLVKTKFANYPKVLLKYRLYPEHGTRATYINQQKDLSNTIRKKQLEDKGISFNEEELSIHNRISTYTYEYTEDFVNKSVIWLRKLMKKFHTRKEKRILLLKIYEVISIQTERNLFISNWRFLGIARQREIKLQIKLFLKNIKRQTIKLLLNNKNK